MIGFWAAFEDARFAAPGTQGQEVGGAQNEHGFQGVLASRGAACGGGGVLPVAHGVQGAFEAELIQGRALLPGALEHDAADEVVGDGVPKALSLSKGRTSSSRRTIAGLRQRMAEACMVVLMSSKYNSTRQRRW